MWGFCGGYCSKISKDDLEPTDLMATPFAEDISEEIGTQAGTLPHAAEFASVAHAPVEDTKDTEKDHKNAVKKLAPRRKLAGPSVSKAAAASQKAAEKDASAKEAAEKAAAEKATTEKAAREAAAEKASRVKELQTKADAELRQGNFVAAADSFTQLLAVNKESAGAWAGRGRAYLWTSRLQDALADLDEALQMDAKLVAAIADRAEVKMQLGDLPGCISDFDKYLALVPCDGRALHQRGSAKQRQGKQDEAAKDFGFAKRLGYTGSSRQKLGGC
jgi:tetratricopeptide (TPR) repeat protein